MDYDKYTDFEQFALEPISRLLRRKYDDSYADYNKDLSSKHRATIREIRDNKREYKSDVYQLNQYIRDLYNKVCALKRSLFNETNAITTYLLDGIVVDNTNNTVINYTRLLYQMVVGIYYAVQVDFDLLNSPAATISIRTLRNKGQRIPNRGSFGLKNLDVNFNAIHTRLMAGNHPFIDPTTSLDNFRRVFSGLNIIEKVVWYNANSLRYLIRELYENKLIESSPEGIWRRTIMCFKPAQGEYETKDFKDTKDPVASLTLLLDEVIRLFSA